MTKKNKDDKDQGRLMMMKTADNEDRQDHQDPLSSLLLLSFSLLLSISLLHQEKPFGPRVL